MLQHICLRFHNVLIKTFFWDISVFKMDDIQLRYQKSLLVSERKKNVVSAGLELGNPGIESERATTALQKNFWCHDSSKQD